MDTRRNEEYERLKAEYKDHYRQIKEAKARLKAAEQKGKIVQALQNLDTNELLESVDEFLYKIKEKVALTEARLELAMENTIETGEELKSDQQEEADEELRKQKARETLKQVKAEMGMLYSEIEKQAEELKTVKTVGHKTGDNINKDSTEG